MRQFALVFVTMVATSGSLGACAKGSLIEGAGGNRVGAGGEEGGGDEGGGGRGDGGSGTGAGTTTSSSSGSRTTTSTTTNTGGAGGMGGGGSGGGGNMCSFVSPNTCAGAEQLPSVSGDEGGTASASGTGSKWFKVQVQETSSSIFEEDLAYAVTLTSPAGMDYDLYVRQGPQDGSPDCNAAEKKGTLSGTTETVSDGWDDDQGIGGEDDDVWLSVEVRHVSGDDCDAKWSLTVKGNP